MVLDTHLQKNHGPMVRQIYSQQLFKCRYLSTDLSTRSIDHDWYQRLIRIHLLENTVDIDGRCWITYGELRWIVDSPLKIEIILWLISSTTPVEYLPFCRFCQPNARISRIQNWPRSEVLKSRDCLENYVKLPLSTTFVSIDYLTRNYAVQERNTN